MTESNIGYKTGIYQLDREEGPEPSKEVVEKNAARIIAIKAEIFSLLKEAEDLADEADLSFSFSVCYGMGGTYYPQSSTRSEDSDDGWVSSSNNC